MMMCFSARGREMSEVFILCVLFEILGRSWMVLRVALMNPLVYRRSPLYMLLSFVILMQIGVVEV